MPKMKTHSGAKKRFKLTGTGKLRRMQANRKSGAAFASAPTTGSRRKHNQKSAMVDVAKADTNGDGQLTGADDPYGPYWPGAEAVDWVGLSMFSYGKGDPTEAAGRAVPLTRSGEVESRFDEDWGYDQPQPGTFYERFAVADDRPMLLDTGALYNRELQGDTELQVKRSWWRQVLAAVQVPPKENAAATPVSRYD